MSQKTGWLLSDHIGQLTMAKDWHRIAGANAVGWGIPAATLTGLGNRIQAANTALSTAKTETTRTSVATTQCKAAYDELTAAMWDMKRCYFLTPSLIDADYIALDFKPHDSKLRASSVPAAQVGQKAVGFLLRSLRRAANSTQLIFRDSMLFGYRRIVRHELGVTMIYVTGSPKDPANKGFRIWYNVIAQGETSPANPDDLRKFFFTKRKKDVIDFDFRDSGKTAYFAV
jgi:hypothetical protein